MPDAFVLYVADTNVYVSAANNPAFRRQFEDFIRARGPLLVSSIVAAEVLVGIPDVTRHPAAVRALSAGTSPLAPTSDDWIQAAMTLARLGGDAVVTKSRSFWNDILLAAQCARMGVVLITRNTQDFRRIGRHLAVTAEPPFPGNAS